MNNESVAHNWVYGDKSISSRGSNFSYDGSKLYSYASLLAKIDRSKKIVYVNSRIAGYSKTSRKHANHMHRAIPSNYDIFEWDFANNIYEERLDKILKLLDMQSRARSRDYSLEIKKLILNTKKYSEIHTSMEKREKKILKEILSVDIDNIIESSKELIKRDKERKEKERKAENKKFQESRQRNLDFFLGQKYNPKDKSTVKFDPNYNSVYLKINGDEIFTSNSIIVPLDKSLVLYRRYLDGKNILGINLGDYSVVKSSKESVTIGCTTISAFELNRVLGNLV